MHSAHPWCSMAELPAKAEHLLLQILLELLLDTFSAAVGLQALPCESFMEQVHQTSNNPLCYQ